MLKARTRTTDEILSESQIGMATGQDGDGFRYPIPILI